MIEYLVSFRPRFLIGALCMMALGLPAFAAAPVNVSRKEAREWIRWVVPLPKQIEIPSKVVLPKTSVVVVSQDNDPVVGQASKELREVIGGQTGKGGFTITLQVGGDASESLLSLENSDQAYRIFPDKDGKGLTLVGRTPVGVYYAAKTLQQLIKPHVSKDSIVMPLVTVTDWPDMEDRGLWGTDSYVRLKWMADRKMNLVEQISFLEVDENGRGHAALKPGRETMIDEAPLYGIKPVPAILHLDQVGNKGLFAAYPELRAQGGEENAMCYSKPKGIITALSDWMVDLVKLPHVTEVDSWLSENLHGKGGCKCEECRKTDRSVKEAEVVLEAWKQAQERAGKFGLRILTSEETGKSNALIMKELPQNTKLWYYHSLYTYTSGKSPMIPNEVADYAARGRWAGVVPSLCAWVNYLEPFTCADFIHYRMNEFVDKKLSGLLGYATPGIPYVRFNTEAAAEWSWNARGRTPREFALSWAVREGIKDPDKFAEWSETMGPAAWDVYGSEWPACEKRQHPGQVVKLLREGRLPELGTVKWGAFRGPWGDIKTSEQLDSDVANAAKGLRIARELGIKQFVQESLAVDGYIHALKALYELKQIVKPEGVTAENKEAAKRYFEMYIDGMKQAAAALPEWEKTVAPQSTDLFVNSSLKLVNRTIDQMQELEKEVLD